MTKRNSRRPIFFIIGYCVLLSFLLIIIDQYCRGVAWQYFNITAFPLSPFVRLLSTEDTETMIFMILSVIGLIPYAIIWGIFYLILYKKQKILPSKKAVILWVCFLIIGFVQGIVYCELEGSSTDAADFYWEYCYYGLPTVVMMLFFIVNTVDFTRLVKATKQKEIE